MKFTKGQNIKVIKLMDDEINNSFLNKTGIIIETTSALSLVRPNPPEVIFYYVIFPNGEREYFFAEELELINY